MTFTLYKIYNNINNIKYYKDYTLKNRKKQVISTAHSNFSLLSEFIAFSAGVVSTVKSRCQRAENFT